MLEFGRDKPLDPRVRRTRVLLHDALLGLVRRKRFEEISLQEIAEAAGLNRATVYAHFGDKYALLASATTAMFGRLVEERGIAFDGTCASAVRSIFLGVCAYIESAGTDECDHRRPIDPHMAAAVVDVVRALIFEGLPPAPRVEAIPSEIVVGAAASAIYGAARAWLALPERGSAEDHAEAVAALVWPMLKSARTAHVGQGRPAAKRSGISA